MLKKLKSKIDFIQLNGKQSFVVGLFSSLHFGEFCRYIFDSAFRKFQFCGSVLNVEDVEVPSIGSSRNFSINI